MSNSSATLLVTATAVANVGGSISEISLLDDTALVEAGRAYAALQRAAQPYGAWIAGEIARRSSREHGFDGLAKREGFIDAAALVQSISGSSRTEAVKLVRVGQLIGASSGADAHGEVGDGAAAADGAADGGLDSPTGAGVAGLNDSRWQRPITNALAEGRLSVDAADAITRGLGPVDDGVSTDELQAAATILVGEAETMNVDRLHRAARRFRDDYDAAGIARREKERRDLQYFAARRRNDGMVVGSFAFADEDGALLLSVYDEATHPRRGGPRFVSARELERAQKIVSDHRTPGQIAAAAVIALLQIGVDADPNTILGARRPSVRVTVTEHSLREHHGNGRVEGMDDPVSLETVERHLCSTGIIGIAFDDDGQCVNVGRDSRLFTQRQRIAMAVRDGGCLVEDCDRPPSWCEAHHIDYWARDSGQTNIADGVLLCRHHHMEIHNNKWVIQRFDGKYHLIPPKGVTTAQRPRPMRSNSGALHDLERERREGRHREPLSGDGAAEPLSGDGATEPRRVLAETRRVLAETPISRHKVAPAHSSAGRAGVRLGP